MYPNFYPTADACAAERQTGMCPVEGKPKLSALPIAARRQGPSILSRRALFAVSTGALASGAGTLVAMRALGSPRRGSMGRAQGGGLTYTPPTWWDGQPLPIKNFFLTWDQLVWTFEQDPTDLAALRATLRTVMQTPGFDELKHNVLAYFVTSQRASYCGDLLHGLIPGASSAEFHGSLFGGLRRMVAELGPATVDAPSRQALLAYRSAGLVPESSVREAFELLMSDLVL